MGICEWKFTWSCFQKLRIWTSKHSSYYYCYNNPLQIHLKQDQLKFWKFAHMFKIKITKKLFANKKIKKRKEKSNSGAKRVYWIQIEEYAFNLWYMPIMTWTKPWWMTEPTLSFPSTPTLICNSLNSWMSNLVNYCFLPRFDFKSWQW